MRIECGSDAVRMSFGCGSDVVRTWLGHVFGSGVDGLQKIKGEWSPVGVSVCLHLLAFACVFTSAFAYVCQRLSAFVCVCSRLLTPPLVACDC